MSAPHPSTAVPSALRELADAAYSSLATFRRDGTPVAVPVWHAVDGNRYYVFTEAASWKVKRLRRNPRVAIRTCDVRGGSLGAREWTGHGRVVEDSATVKRAYAALDRKYGWQKWLVDAMSRLTGRYHKRAILEVVLDA